MKRLLFAACAACSAPTVQMKLVVADNLAMTDTSCVTGVEVRAVGTRYAQDQSDVTSSCLALNGGTYGALETAMSAKYVVTIPSDGLAGIEVRGYAGAGSCDPASFGGSQDPFTPDLIFTASSTYIGQDTILLPVAQNLTCHRAPFTIHVTDLITLVQGNAPTDAACASATTVSDGTANGGPAVGTGTLVPGALEQSAQFFGDFFDFAPFTNKLATFTGYDQAGPKSCVAITGGNDTGFSQSCVIANPVCPGSSKPGEIELTAIANAVGSSALQLDTTLLQKFPGVVVGSVWTGTASKHAVTGATVSIDPSLGKVVYVDPTGTTGVVKRTDQSGTGASGMFLLYTSSVAQVTVASGSLSRTVVLSAAADFPAGALVLVN